MELVDVSVVETDESFQGGFERGTYVQTRNGLFPAAWPANALPPGAEERFRVLGIALAKCLQVLQYSNGSRPIGTRLVLHRKAVFNTATTKGTVSPAR